jgi:hypothetical protein
MARFGHNRAPPITLEKGNEWIWEVSDQHLRSSFFPFARTFEQFLKTFFVLISLGALGILGSWESTESIQFVELHR